MAPLLSHPDRPLIIAHRGASGIVGEDNTLKSFRRAIALGADAIECDIQRCSCGTLVVFHDNEIDGTPLSALTHAALKAKSDLDIPALSDLIPLADDILLDIEIKQCGWESEVAAQLAGLSPDRFVIKSFTPSVIQSLQTIQPNWAMGLLLSERHPRYKDALLAAPHLNLSFLCPDAKLHQSLDLLPDLPRWVWTVNEPSAMHGLNSAGIITDRPDWAIACHQITPSALDQAQLSQRLAYHQGGELIDALAGRDVCGEPITTRHIRSGAGVIKELPQWCESLFKSQRIAVICDQSTQALLPNTIDYHQVVLEPLPGWDHVTPHLSFVETVKAKVGDVDALVSLGAGTLNDITKYAATALDLPYIACATAASMNGYTSSIAALLVDGLKSTLPCKAPVAVIADTTIIANAPPMMARSGYADLLSKPVSTADWRLASLVRGEAFNPVPGQLVESAIDQCTRQAEAIATQELVAIEDLMNCLILSGFSMTIAGSSAPASGGEHLISHYWDMQAYSAEREPAAHGFQVALGTLMTSKLYAYIQALDPESLSAPSTSLADKKIQHGELWSFIEKEAIKVTLPTDAAKVRTAHIKGIWSELWPVLQDYLVSHQTIYNWMVRAGVPTKLEAHGISLEQAKHAFKHACDIRDRYTVLHFATDIGALDDAVDAVFAQFVNER